MAAGLGFKDFTTGEVLTAGDVDGYLMQGVWVFASAAARDAAVTSPQEGNFAYLKDTNVTTYYTGSAWANLDTTGMTNPMTTTGDTIYSSSGSTPARLGIGSTGNVLTVAGGVPTWAAPAGGGGMTSIATGSLSGTSTSITGISGSYIDLQLVINDWNFNSANGRLKITFNSNTSNYSWWGIDNINSSPLASQWNNFSSVWGNATANVGANGNTAVIEIKNYASTVSRKVGTIYSGAYNTSSNPTQAFTPFSWGDASAITSIQIENTSSGSYTGGTYILYGVK